MARPKRRPADALRGVPPPEFVQARNGLVTRLAKSGKTAESRQVARLRRPSPVLWALNRAATSRAHELRALVQAVDRLRQAQLGRGDPRAATEEYRTAFEPLVRGAGQVLRDAAVRVSPALDRRIRSTLLAAVTDRSLRADLEGGRLAEEHADPASPSSPADRFRPSSCVTGPGAGPRLGPTPRPPRPRGHRRAPRNPGSWPASKPARRARREG
jgi:hypothetical protein